MAQNSLNNYRNLKSQSLPLPLCKNCIHRRQKYTHNHFLDVKFRSFPVRHLQPRI